MVSNTPLWCELCGGEIQSRNQYGVCRSGTPLCKSEYYRRWRTANREKVAESSRLYVAANREKTAEYQRQYREDNCEKIAEYKRQYGKANREKIAARGRRDRKDNPEKHAVRGRRYYKANREKVLEYQHQYYKVNGEKVRVRVRQYQKTHRKKIAAKVHRRYIANREGITLEEAAKRALRGGLPQSERRGHLSSSWRGGEKMYCSFPGCHRVAGWRRPWNIRQNKTGYRCPVHKNIHLPEITEQDYVYQSPEELQSSMSRSKAVSKTGTPRQCELCGGPVCLLYDKYGVCQRNPTCNAEYHRRYQEVNREKLAAQSRVCYYRRVHSGPPPQCELCGGKIRLDNKYGVCRRTPLCVSEHCRRHYRANREANRGKNVAGSRRYYETNRERILAQRRKKRKMEQG